MVFNIIDTPRTEIGDQTRMSGLGDMDFSMQHSMPSPTKGGNDLLTQIQGMRPSSRTTPRPRGPLLDRRNAPSKVEFTPLLKSAARNNFRNAMAGQENMRPLQTPAGLRRELGHDSPALPFNSSIIIEDPTVSDQDDGEGPSLAPPIESSSIASTPLAPRLGGEGPLDHRGNLATLREQEARLEQIDKENFSLKLKIHFMEEALRRNGKEFNEAAIKENTELKVDKVTLQRDLKQCRKQLAQSAHDLAQYRQQFQEYAQKLKGRHASEEMQEELARLRKLVADKEAETSRLGEQIRQANDLDAQMSEVQDECEDLRHELRTKEREVEEKDDELEKLRGKHGPDDALAAQLASKDKLLADKDAEVAALRQAMAEAETGSAERLAEQEQLLEDREDEIAELSEQLKSLSGDASIIRSKDHDLEEHRLELKSKEEEIALLKRQLEDADGDKSMIRSQDRQAQAQREIVQKLESQLAEANRAIEGLEDLKRQLLQARADLESQAQRERSSLEEKDRVLRSLQQKLDSTNNRDQATEKLQDRIDDLEAEMREKEAMIGKHEDELDALDEMLRKEREQADDDLRTYEDRNLELENQQRRTVEELQELRDASHNPSDRDSQAVQAAENRIRALEDHLAHDRERELELQGDINKLHEKIQALERDLRRKNDAHTTEREGWSFERRSLESAKSRADDLVASLQRTISQLKTTEGDLSGREVQLQRLLDGEKQRRESEEVSWAKELAEVRKDAERHRKSYQDASLKSTDTQHALSVLQARLDESREQQHKLTDQVQALEDDLEILQNGIDDEADQASTDLAAARREIDSTRTELRTLQQKVTQSESRRDDLQHELDQLKSSRAMAVERHDQQSQTDIKALQEKLRETREEARNLQSLLNNGDKVASSSVAAQTGSIQVSVKMHDLQDRFDQVSRERSNLEDDLGAANSQLDILRKSDEDARQERDNWRQSARELKTQIGALQREHDRRSQSLVVEYERDIANLEQDLNKAQADKLAAETRLARSQTKLATLESQLTTLRTQRGKSESSVMERTDLQMLKDAKLEAEDLEIQIKERDGRLRSAVTKEAELRDHLKRLRDERAAQSSRADLVSRDLDRLQREHDVLIDALASARAVASQKQVQFPGVAPHSKADTIASQKRHAAELRGLVKQIEYLGARCRREERFRADLGYIKTYFTKQVEMHGMYTSADLKLVHAMGIPTAEVVEEQRAVLEEGVGRRETRNGSRPSLKCVGLMLLAAARMKRAAEGWGQVRVEHDALLRKLKDVQLGRRRVSGKT